MKTGTEIILENGTFYIFQWQITKFKEYVNSAEFPKALCNIV